MAHFTPTVCQWVTRCMQKARGLFRPRADHGRSINRSASMMLSRPAPEGRLPLAARVILGRGTRGPFHFRFMGRRAAMRACFRPIVFLSNGAGVGLIDGKLPVDLEYLLQCLLCSRHEVSDFVLGRLTAFCVIAEVSYVGKALNEAPLGNRDYAAVLQKLN